jgi:hypothetical protein
VAGPAEPTVAPRRVNGDGRCGTRTSVRIAEAAPCVAITSLLPDPAVRSTVMSNALPTHDPAVAVSTPLPVTSTSVPLMHRPLRSDFGELVGLLDRERRGSIGVAITRLGAEVQAAATGDQDEREGATHGPVSHKGGR